jgi:uncharacterized protein
VSAMPASPQPDVVLRNVAAFGRVLRDAGLEVGPRRLQTAVAALEALGLRTREGVYWALSCSLVSRREEAAAFDRAFAAFWDRRLPEPDTEPPRPPGAEEHDEEPPAASAPPRSTPGAEAGEAAPGEPGDEAGDAAHGSASSPEERLRHLDFASYSPADLVAARAYLERLRHGAPQRRSRRLEPDRGGRRLDRRATLRSAMRTEGHPVDRSWQEPRLVPRRLIFLIDVSGSMEAYARPLILFAQVVRQAVRKVEVFTFGTRLTRITAELAGRDAGRALRKAAAAIPDWAGGTRIGDNVKAFNDTAGRQGLTRGAVVVVFSDGCERGEPELLADEMTRVHRAAHTVVWVNPLARDERYEPRTRGMIAALPSIDVLLAGHDLAALEALADVLDAIPDRRSRARP